MRIVHPQKIITKATVKSAHEKQPPTQICFSRKHKRALKRTKKPYIGAFNVPFGEGFRNLFPFNLSKNPHDKYHENAYWRSIQSEDEYGKVEQWIKEQGERVFLRDCLCVSIALSHNLEEPGKYTHIGRLEYRAKNKQNENAINELAKLTIDAINSFAIYRKVDCICAMPSHPSKPFDLPKEVVSKVNAVLKKEDITSCFSFGSKKAQVKKAPFDEKWQIWEDAHLSFSGNIKGKSVILVDDKYQSGISIQFVASKLLKEGASRIYGLCFVKTLRNDGNV